MTATFLDRNKKKSLLAALLLFLRQRKILVLLLLLMLIASTVFLSPSSWLTSFPGGQRFAAGVAWIAGKMGVDVSRWGLGTGKHSYDDLLAAFRAAKTGPGGGGGGAGWGAFFGHGGRGSGAGSGDGSGAPNSLDFVKGSKSDLDHGTGAGADGAGAGGAGSGTPSVVGAVDPAAPKNRDSDGVTLWGDDLRNERESIAKGSSLAGGLSLAGGFMKGLLGGGGGGAGGSGGTGDGALSGGAYANKGFFSGKGGAAGMSNGLAKNGLAGLPSLSTPSSTKGGAGKAALSGMDLRAASAKAQKGVASAGAVGGNLAYTQLAEGSARAQLGAQYCQPPDCPAEYASTNTGAVYDGNNITSGFLTSSDPGANAAGLINSSVVVPPSSSLAGNQDAMEMMTCQTDAMQCAQAQQQLAVGFGPLQDRINADVPQLGGACGNVCDCGSCNSLNNDINAQCNAIGNLSNEIENYPCSMPADCSSLNIASPPNSSRQGAMCPGMGCHKKPWYMCIF